MDLQLKNKIVLVTGASRGLGFATALLLSREGALVAINSRNAEKLAVSAQSISQLSGNKVYALPGDLARPETPQEIVLKTVDTFGGLDILITNAGGPPAGPFESFDDAAWQNAFDLTFMSHLRLIRSALPYLKKSPAPSVLAVTSYSTKQPIPNLILSNSIRSATNGLIKTLALELGDQGIRFNAILPAWTDTERVQNLMENRAKLNHTSVAEEVLRQSKESPLGRMSRPEEFANVAVFLVSPAASYITGAMFSVDGGMVKGVY